MGLPRAFVGFSSTDILSYYLMKAWKKNEHIDFNFTDCQLRQEVRSDNELYIKKKLRERINMAGTFISLIGEDTKYKEQYVLWELEAALDKECRIIGVNLNGSCGFDSKNCPDVIKNVGAIFVPFSPKIIAYALENWEQKDSGNWIYKDWVYQSLGY